MEQIVKLNEQRETLIRQITEIDFNYAQYFNIDQSITNHIDKIDMRIDELMNRLGSNPSLLSSKHENPKK